MKFNDIMRQKFSERKDISSDLENFENIRKMLANARKKEKRRRFFIIFFLGLSIGIAVMSPFISFRKKNDQNISDKTVSASSVDHKLNTNSFVASDSSAVKNAIASDHVAVNNGNNTSNAQSLNSSTNIQTNNSSRNDQTINVSTKKNLMPINWNSSFSKNHYHSTVLVDGNGLNNNDHAVPKNNSTNDVAVNDDSAVKANLGNNNFSSIVNENSKEKKDSVASNAISSNDNIVVKNILMNDTTKNPADSLKNSSDVSNNIVPSKNDPVKKNFFQLQVGCAATPGWKYGDTVEGRGINPLIGLEYRHQFKGKWCIETGIHFSTIGYMHESTHSIKHVNCGFGYQAIDSLITTNWLYYFAVPFDLRFQINAKNSISAGITLAHVCFSSGTLTTFKESDDLGITERKTSLQTNYHNGYNPWNATVSVAYSRRLNDQMEMEIIPYYGLMDIKNNSYFMKNKTERDLGCKIILAYTF